MAKLAEIDADLTELPDYEKGIRLERERILKWIESNRSAIEIDAGINVYRDHFDSESLIEFIEARDEKL
jgi:hypothetical protein